MKVRVLIVGDSPRLTTGFGRVNAEAVKAFKAQGWEVASLGGLTDETTPITDDGIKMFTPSGYKGDVWGFYDVPKVIKKYKPDLVFGTCDPGTVVTASSVIPEGQKVLFYSPIEGEPLSSRQWQRTLRALPFFTCSEYGVKVAKDGLDKDIDYVYHGIDHETFNVQPRMNGMRDAVRKRMGWEGKFVVMTVSTNVRRKQIPRIIEALSILRHRYGQKDIVLYLHTVPFQHYWLDGWNLPEITEMYGVQDICYFNPLMSKMNASVPEITGNPESPGLVEIYNSADVFVLASQVEGFGLPIAESMACGLPVIVPRYAAGWEVASPAGRGLPIRDWEVHKSSTRYANISPEDLAKEILRLKRSPKDAQRMSDAGLERVKDFQWSAFHTKVVEQAKEVLASGNKAGNTIAEKADPAEKGKNKARKRNALSGGKEALPENEVLNSRTSKTGNDEGPPDGSMAAQEEEG